MLSLKIAAHNPTKPPRPDNFGYSLSEVFYRPPFYLEQKMSIKNDKQVVFNKSKISFSPASEASREVANLT